MDDDEQALVSELVRLHGCDTVILYGSRARGDARPDSDWDVLGIRTGGVAEPDTRAWRGAWLDARIVPQAEVVAGPSFLQLRGGRVLAEQGGVGTALLAALEDVFTRGPTPLSTAELTLRRTWCEKTLGRVRGAVAGDLEAAYRRANLLVDLLTIYFELRGRWYLGAKESLGWLRAFDAETYGAYSDALAGDQVALETLVRRCCAQM